MDSLENHEQALAISRLVDRWAEKHLSGQPNWEPLEGVVPREWCGGFMWMQRIDEDGTRIELYKHGITRRHLNLDHDGQAYKSTGSRYVQISLDDAIEWVFEGIEEMGWSRDTDYDNEFIARKHKALRDAGWTVITTAPAQLDIDVHSSGRGG